MCPWSGGRRVPGWLAAAAMLLGWRDRKPSDATQLLQRLTRPVLSRRPARSRPRTSPDTRRTRPRAGAAGDSTTVDSAQLVGTRGPQWVGVAGAEPRFVVVTGLYGDGTPGGTYVRISDPSAQPLGPERDTIASGTGMGPPTSSPSNSSWTPSRDRTRAWPPGHPRHGGGHAGQTATGHVTGIRGRPAGPAPVRRTRPVAPERRRFLRSCPS